MLAEDAAWLISPFRGELQKLREEVQVEESRYEAEKRRLLKSIEERKQNLAFVRRFLTRADDEKPKS